MPGIQELSALTAAADGTVFVADHDALQVVSIGADGRVGSCSRRLAGPMDWSRRTAPCTTSTTRCSTAGSWRCRPAAPEGLTQPVERDGEGNPVEPPSEGAPAGDSYIDARDLAATDHGLLVLTFTNEVWRIGDDAELELVLRRGDDSALVALGRRATTCTCRRRHGHAVDPGVCQWAIGPARRLLEAIGTGPRT